MTRQLGDDSRGALANVLFRHGYTPEATRSSCTTTEILGGGTVSRNRELVLKIAFYLVPFRDAIRLREPRPLSTIDPSNMNSRRTP